MDKRSNNANVGGCMNYKLGEHLPAGMGEGGSFYSYICVPKINGCEGCSHRNSKINSSDCYRCGDLILIKKQMNVKGEIMSIVEDLREAAEDEKNISVIWLLKSAAKCIENLKEEVKEERAHSAKVEKALKSVGVK